MKKISTVAAKKKAASQYVKRNGRENSTEKLLLKVLREIRTGSNAATIAAETSPSDAPIPAEPSANRASVHAPNPQNTPVDSPILHSRMKMAPEDLEVLYSCANVGPGLLIQAGNVVMSVSKDSGTVIRATVGNPFPVSCALVNISQVMESAAALKYRDTQTKDWVYPWWSFQKDHLELRDDLMHTMRFYYVDKSAIMVPPEDVAARMQRAKTDAEVKFALTSQDLALMLKISSINGLPECAFKSSGGGAPLICSVFDRKNPTSRDFSFEAGPGNGDEFNMIVGVDRLRKLRSANYAVGISSQNVAHFKHLDREMEYIVALDPESSKYTASRLQKAA